MTATQIQNAIKVQLIDLFNDVKRYRDNSVPAYEALDGNATQDLETVNYFVEGQNGELDMLDEPPTDGTPYAEISTSWGAYWDGCPSSLDSIDEHCAREAATRLAADCVHQTIAAAWYQIELASC